jgi:hypothetical protein
MYTASLIVLALLTLVGVIAPLWAARRSLRGVRIGIWLWIMAPSAVLGWGSACAVWAMAASPVLGDAVALVGVALPDLIVTYWISAGLLLWSSALASFAAMRAPGQTIPTEGVAVLTGMSTTVMAGGLVAWALLSTGWSASTPAWFLGFGGILLALASRRREQVPQDSRLASVRMGAAISLVAAVLIAASATTLGAQVWSLSHLATFDADIGWWVQEQRAAMSVVGWPSVGAALLVSLIATAPELGVAMGTRFGRDLVISGVILASAAVGTLFPAFSTSSLLGLATNQVQFEAGALLAQEMTERRLGDGLVHLDRVPIGDVVEYKRDGWMVTWRRTSTGWEPAFDLVDTLPPDSIAHPLVIAPSTLPVKTVVHLIESLPDGVPAPAILLRQTVTEFTLPSDFAPLQYTHLVVNMSAQTQADLQAVDAGQLSPSKLAKFARTHPEGPVPIGVQSASIADLWHTCAGIALDLSTDPPTRTGRFCVVATTERAARR